MRGILLALLLVAAGISGCIGDGGVSTSSVEQETSGCSHQGKNGRVMPGASLVVEGEAGGAPANAHILFESDNLAGTIHLGLEHDGDEVWSHDLQGVGDYDHSTHMDGLDAGNYVLTASADDGYSEATLQLQVTWGGGTCD